MHLLVKMATRFLVLPALLAALALWYVRMGRGDETDGLVADATSKIAEEHFVYGALRDRQAQEAGLSALAASVPGGAAFWLAEGDLQRGYRLRKTMQGGALWARPDGAYWRVLGLEPDTPLRSAGLAPGAKIRARGGDLFFRCPLGVGRLILAGGVEAGDSWEVLEKGQRRILTVTASEAGERGLGVRAYANGLLYIRCRVLSLQTALRLRRLLRPIEVGVSTLTLDLRGCWDGDEAGVRAWYRLLGAGEVRLRTGDREGFPGFSPLPPCLRQEQTSRYCWMREPGAGQRCWGICWLWATMRRAADARLPAAEAFMRIPFWPGGGCFAFVPPVFPCQGGP